MTAPLVYQGAVGGHPGVVAPADAIGEGVFSSFSPTDVSPLLSVVPPVLRQVGQAAEGPQPGLPDLSCVPARAVTSSYDEPSSAGPAQVLDVA